MINISIKNIRDRDISTESRLVRFFAANEDASYTASANNSALSHGDNQFQICFAPMPSLCEIASDLLGIWIEDYEEYGICEWKLLNKDTKEVYGEGSFNQDDYIPSSAYQNYNNSLGVMIAETVQNTTNDISIFIGGYESLIFVNNTGEPISLRLSIKNVYNFPDIDYDNPPETLPEGYEDFSPRSPMLEEHDFYDNITNPSFSVTYENEAENIPAPTKVIGEFCLKPYNYCIEEPVEIQMVNKGIDISNKGVIICYNRYGYDEYYHMFTGSDPDSTPNQDPDYTSYISNSLSDLYLGNLNTYYTDDYVHEGTSPCNGTGFVPATTIKFSYSSYGSSLVSFNYSEDEGITWKKITGYPTSSFDYSDVTTILKAIKIGMEADGYTVTNTSDSISVSKSGIQSLLIASTGSGYYFYVNGSYWDYYNGSRYVDGLWRDTRTIYPITCDNGYKDPMRNIEKVYYVYTADGFFPHMPSYNSKTYYIKKATDLEEGQVDFLSTFTNYDQIAITKCDGGGGGYYYN